jgi:hypothetical protein
MLQVLAIAGGIILILGVLWDAFESTVVPRRVSRATWLTTLFYRLMCPVWRRTAARIRSPRGRPRGGLRPPALGRADATAHARRPIGSSLRPLHERHDALQSGIAARSDAASLRRLDELRAMYELQAQVLSGMLLMPLPPWVPAAAVHENWHATAPER